MPRSHSSCPQGPLPARSWVEIELVGETRVFELIRENCQGEAYEETVDLNSRSDGVRPAPCVECTRSADDTPARVWSSCFGCGTERDDSQYIQRHSQQIWARVQADGRRQHHGPAAVRTERSD